MLRQIGLISAGCQPWNLNMVSGTGSRFAYCSTMAVYIYEYDTNFGEYKLTSINAEHTKTITCIAWDKSYPNLIATASSDRRILVWDVVKRRVIAQLPELKVVPNCISWMPGQHDSPRISYVASGGCLEMWNVYSGKVLPNKEVTGIHCEVTVFSWHHTRHKNVALGFDDGSVCYFVQDKHKLRKKVMTFSEDEEAKDSVLVLSWDPLSNDYLLVANKLSGLRLIDTSSCTVVTTFSLPSKAVSTCTFSWINSAPGMFLTGDKETGVMRLWSVGRSQPLESFKLKQTGFNCLHVLDSDIEENLQTDENMNQGSMRRHSSSSSQMQAQTHSVPPAGVVCTFRDGGVGLYNLQRRKWHFLKEQGHIETIFDCKFKPDDYRMLATASFDGTIKVWSTKDMKAQHTSAGNEGVIYSLSWAPENLNCIACGTRRGGVFVWDLNKGKVLRRFTEHGQRAVYCVAWNQRDSHRIASSSEDCTCVVRRLDGKEVRRFTHPAPVYGCDWNLFDKDLFATGCEDGVVRVWNIAETSKCLHKLKGHEDKVFHVRWHPLLKNILSSGSDDCTVRVWDIDRNGASFCVAVLTGHTSSVRGLTWNFEIPYLLISGSWDSTIRLWDARESTQQSLEVVKDHGADVYGLTSHPMSPFMLASSSRDSTLRLWSLAPAVSLLFLKVIADHPLTDIISSPEECMQNQPGLKLAGRMSKQIVEQLEGKSKQDGLKLRWFSELFCASPGLENLWDVACCSNGSAERSLSSGYKNGILHMSHVTKYKASEAQELELSAMNRSLAGNKQQDTALEKASDIYLKLGNLRRHCESLKNVGRWEAALALAPGVSQKYWRQLATQYAKVLEMAKDKESLSYNVSLGNVEKSVQFLCDSGEYQDALLLAQSAAEGHTPAHSSTGESNRSSVSSVNALSNGSADPSARDFTSLVTMCCNKLSEKKFVSGDPFSAATHLISNDKISAAIGCLIQANELSLALCLGRALKHNDSAADAAALLCRKLEGERRYFFAIEMAKMFSEVTSDTTKWNPLFASCARYDGDDANRENLYEYAGLKSPKDFELEARLLEEQSELTQAVRCYLLSNDQLQGLKLGIKLLCGELRKKSWTLSTEFLADYLPVFCVSCRTLDNPSVARDKNKLLALSAYIGALQAIRLAHTSVVGPLFEHAIAMTERLEMMPAERSEDDVKPMPFPLSSSTIREELNAWKLYLLRRKHHSDRVDDGLKTDETMQKIFRKAGVEEFQSPFNETMVAGSSLPSHSDVHVSSLTNTRISGAIFCLEDDSAVISLNEAIMWAKVNQFSPTGSGARIHPF